MVDDDELVVDEVVEDVLVDVDVVVESLDRDLGGTVVLVVVDDVEGVVVVDEGAVVDGMIDELVDRGTVELEDEPVAEATEPAATTMATAASAAAATRAGCLMTHLCLYATV